LAQENADADALFSGAVVTVAENSLKLGFGWRSGDRVLQLARRRLVECRARGRRERSRQTHHETRGLVRNGQVVPIEQCPNCQAIVAHPENQIQSSNAPPTKQPIGQMSSLPPSMQSSEDLEGSDEE